MFLKNRDSLTVLLKEYMEKLTILLKAVNFVSESSILFFSVVMSPHKTKIIGEDGGNADPLKLLGSSHVIFGQMINLSVSLDCRISFTFISTNCFLVVSFIIALFHI